MRREALWSAAALGGSILLALAAAELVVRATWGDLMPTGVIKKHLIEPDPVLDWRLRPNVRLELRTREFGEVRFESNARGVRADREIPYEKPAGVRRLVALGDSFTYGQWVNLQDTYVARIAAALPGWEAVNLGVFGYDADRELYALETEGIRYAPDLVVQFFCIDNDFFPSEEIPLAIYKEEGGRLLRRAAEERPAGRSKVRARGAFMRLVVDRSDLYWFLHVATSNLRAGLLRKSEPPSHKLVPYAKAFPDEAQRPGVAFTFAELREMRRVAEAAGARFLIVAVEANAVDPEIWARLLDHPAVRPEDFDPGRPERLLREFAEREGIAYVQPSDRMRAFPGEVHVLRGDGHYNALGHRRAAAAAAERLRELGWAP